MNNENNDTWLNLNDLHPRRWGWRICYVSGDHSPTGIWARPTLRQRIADRWF
jgi:hypothetical protein